jgi:hypothetical protein
MGMLIEEVNSYWPFLLGKLEVPSQIIDILANFALRSQLDRSWIFYAVRTLLNNHRLEDVRGQEHPDFLLLLVDLGFKQKDERTYWIL